MKQPAKLTDVFGRQYHSIVVTADDCEIYVLSDAVPLTEAQHRGVPIGGKYSVVSHSPHTPSGQYHFHVFARNNQLFAINIDGTAHDQSHGIRIPNKVADALRQEFPNILLPPDNLIESAGEYETQMAKQILLIE